MSETILPIETSPEDIQRRIDAGEPLALIDVREPEEFAITRIEGATLIPMREIPASLQQLEEDRNRQLWQKRISFVIIIFIISTTIIIIVYLVRMRRNEQAAFRHQATQLQMQALRSQMNPHFIFNSLNAINRFILENKQPQASAYLRSGCVAR